MRLNQILGGSETVASLFMPLINTLDRSEKNRITIQERTSVSSRKTSQPSGVYFRKQEQHSSSNFELKNTNLSVNENPLYPFSVYAILRKLESKLMDLIQTQFDESVLFRMVRYK